MGPSRSVAVATVIAEIKEATYALARELQVRGLMNIQFAVKTVDGHHTVYVLEVNPRASRTSPFVSKATGRPLAKIAAKIMAGVSLAEQGIVDEIWPRHMSVKESVFPFSRFSGVDIILGPEMRSTGEVMGIDEKFALAFAKSQIAAGISLPTEGTVFISMTRDRKQMMIEPARRLKSLGFKLVCTQGTARVLADAGIEVETVRKVQEGRPNLLDKMANGEIQFIFNTPSGKGARTDEGRIRSAAVAYGVPVRHHDSGLPRGRQSARGSRQGSDSARPSLAGLDGFGTRRRDGRKVNRPDCRLVLGSRSPRRLELLRQIHPAELIDVVPPSSTAEAHFEDVHDWPSIERRLLGIAQAKCDDVAGQVRNRLQAGDNRADRAHSRHRGDRRARRRITSRAGPAAG